MKKNILAMLFAFAIGLDGLAIEEGPKPGDTRRVELGGGVTLEVLYIPPGEFRMGSTPEEKKWATGIEGGAQAGTERESYEGKEPRAMKVSQGFYMGRTEVTVGQFRRFIEETGYVTDAEKPDGKTQCFNPAWTRYNLSTQVTHPWEPMPGKSWRDPNFQFPLRDDFPVVCVSWTDAKAFAMWLTQHERSAGRLPEGLVYRLPK
ncbi:MAG: formylglycine-generating enzyme family protein, partial [Pirellula sp.]